jgi:hypothetical protein
VAAQRNNASETAQLARIIAFLLETRIVHRMNHAVDEIKTKLHPDLAPAVFCCWIL